MARQTAHSSSNKRSLAVLWAIIAGGVLALAVLGFTIAGGTSRRQPPLAQAAAASSRSLETLGKVQAEKQAQGWKPPT